MARAIGSSGCSRGAMVSSRYSAMAFDSNSEMVSSTRSTGTFLCGEIARNQSGRLSRSICRNSKSIFFSRSTIAARCTHGQVLKLTNRYFAISSLATLCPRLLFCFQLAVVRRDKFADVVGFVEQPQPLLLVERHRETAHAVDRQRALFAHLHAQAGRRAFLQRLVLLAQPFQLGLHRVVGHA